MLKIIKIMENLTLPDIPSNVSITAITYLVEINRYQLDLNEILNKVSFGCRSKFANCLMFKFNRQNIKLFSTGKLHVTGMYDPDTAKKNIVSIIKHIDDATVNNVTPSYIGFSIDNLDLDKVHSYLTNHQDVDSKIPYNYKWNKSVFTIDDKVKVNTAIGLIGSYNFIMKSQFSWYNPFSWFY